MIANVIYFVITLGVLIAFHEWGHFQVARLCGVRVLRFSIGFGSPLLRWKDKLGTEFVVAAIPLGGYVKMLDLRERSVSDDELPFAYNNKPLWKKAAIISAGPLANFLLAILVYWLVSMLGVQGIAPKVGDVDPDSPAYQAGLSSEQWIRSIDGRNIISQADAHIALVERIGDTGTIKITTSDRRESTAAQRQHSISITRWLEGQKDPNIYQSLGFDYWFPATDSRINEVVPESAAERGGMLAGDLIVAIDQQAIDSWMQAVETIRSKVGETIAIQVERQAGEYLDLLTLNIDVQPVQLENGETVGRIGVAVAPVFYPEEMRVLQQSGFIDGIAVGMERTWHMTALTVESIGKMITGLISPSNLSGPITIARVAADTAESGLVSYLQFLALLSVSLGVLNLLPVPMLDGGQLVFIGYEAITKRPVPEKVQLGMQQVGLVLILFLMSFALFNDFSRLF